MSTPIDLYFWPTPNGWKITIMLEECGLPYQIQPVNIGRGDQLKESFLKLSPNGRMPAIIDPEGPGGKPISIFESGAILQYLGDKAGQFYPQDRRRRTEIEQWVYWQVGGLGPMAGQVAHFRNYIEQKIPYAIERYTNEVHRLYGVLDKQLGAREFVAGEYSIADMAIWPWVRGYKVLGQNLDDFPALQEWFKRVGARPGVIAGSNAGKELRGDGPVKPDPEAQKILFGQRSTTPTGE